MRKLWLVAFVGMFLFVAALYGGTWLGTQSGWWVQPSMFMCALSAVAGALATVFSAVALWAWLTEG